MEESWGRLSCITLVIKLIYSLLSSFIPATTTQTPHCPSHIPLWACFSFLCKILTHSTTSFIPFSSFFLKSLPFRLSLQCDPQSPSICPSLWLNQSSLCNGLSVVHEHNRHSWVLHLCSSVSSFFPSAATCRIHWSTFHICSGSSAACSHTHWQHTHTHTTQRHKNAHWKFRLCFSDKWMTTICCIIIINLSIWIINTRPAVKRQRDYKNRKSNRIGIRCTGKVLWMATYNIWWNGSETFLRWSSRQKGRSEVSESGRF